LSTEQPTVFQRDLAVDPESYVKIEGFSLRIMDRDSERTGKKKKKNWEEVYVST